MDLCSIDAVEMRLFDDFNLSSFYFPHISIYLVQIQNKIKITIMPITLLKMHLDKKVGSQAQE